LVALRLSPEDRARVQAALAAEQARTHVRFALMIVGVSDRYAMYPLAFAGAVALAVAGALAFFWQDVGLRIGFLIEAGAFGLAALATEWRPLRLALVPTFEKQMRARAMAHREFAAGILAARDHAEGLLFFASLGEHYVEIIASREVHARVGEDAWTQIVNAFSARAKTGALADAFIQAIDACAAHLEANFPPVGPSEAHA
jgi:putative membrane protein